MVKRGFFYAFSSIALNIATYHLSGGAFNISVLMGSLIFNQVVDSRYIGLFFGAILGAQISRLLHNQLFVEKKKEVDPSALKLLENK